MSPQALQQRVNGFDGGSHCLFENEQMERMISAVKEQTGAIKRQTQATIAQNDNFKYITKYLLIVVCIIAVGQKAIDAARDIWGHKSTTLTADK